MKLYVIIFAIGIVLVEQNTFAEKGVQQKPNQNLKSGILLEPVVDEAKWLEKNLIDMENSVNSDGAQEKRQEEDEQNNKATKGELLMKTGLNYLMGLLEQVLSEDYGKFIGEAILPEKSKPTAQREKRSRERFNPANNTISNWILSLVQVEGESLPNFLRIYRVQLLFDLAFSIFKWFFYAYLGWLIP